MKRVKKKINDYILNNYNKLFFKSPEKEETPTKDKDVDETESKETDRQTLSAEEILSNQELLAKVEAELRMSDE